jgi:hypothetical protein
MFVAILWQCTWSARTALVCTMVYTIACVQCVPIASNGSWFVRHAGVLHTGTWNTWSPSYSSRHVPFENPSKTWIIDTWLKWNVTTSFLIGDKWRTCLSFATSRNAFFRHICAVINVDSNLFATIISDHVDDVVVGIGEGGRHDLREIAYRFSLCAWKQLTAG